MQKLLYGLFSMMQCAISFAHLYVKFNATGSSSQQLKIETPLKRPFCEKAQFREKTFCLVPEAKRKWKCKTEEMSRFGGNAINFQ